LGYGLGFTFEDITRVYFSKNQINFKRQKDNY
jgi:dimeric dUTPase (all-alpha-NTP-PPase superfamily)